MYLRTQRTPMNISDWSLYYKVHETKLTPTTTQRCYEPLVNPEGNVFCMNFCFPCEYQATQPRVSYTQEFVDYMFERELHYLSVFEGKAWAPEILDIVGKRIFIKWYGKTCNDSIYRDDNLNGNWFTDIERIILEQVNLGYLKATVYPHSHYYDNNGQMRAIDFYACVEKDNPTLPLEKIVELTGEVNTRFQDATADGVVNVESIFKSGLLQYSQWPRQLTEVYNKIYGNS